MRTGEKTATQPPLSERMRPPRARHILVARTGTVVSMLVKDPKIQELIPNRILSDSEFREKMRNLL